MTTQAPPSKVLTPELQTSLMKRTDLFPPNVTTTANSTTQYASQTPSLTHFRDTVSIHGKVDATLLNDFRKYVPVADYEPYRPWIARFHENPCKEWRVGNLFAPGLPYYFVVSSATSVKEPKLFPAYQNTSFEYPPPPCPIFDFSDIDTGGPMAWIFYYGYREIQEVEWEPGQVVKRIPPSLSSAGRLRIHKI